MNSPTTQHASLEQTLKAQVLLIRHKGVKLYCPYCKEPNSCIAVELVCPTEFYCRECDSDFDLDQIRNLILGAKKWEKLVGWLATFPDFRQEAAEEPNAETPTDGGEWREDQQ